MSAGQGVLSMIGSALCPKCSGPPDMAVIPSGYAEKRAALKRNHQPVTKIDVVTNLAARF